MDRASTQPSKIDTASDESLANNEDSAPVYSPQSASSAQSFFNSSERSQAPSQPQVSFNADSALLLLLSALLEEFRRHNDIEVFKLKLEADKKQADIESAENEHMEDEERFNAVRHSLYS